MAETWVQSGGDFKKGNKKQNRLYFKVSQLNRFQKSKNVPNFDPGSHKWKLDLIVAFVLFFGQNQ